METKKLTGPQVRVLRGISIHGYRMVRDSKSADILLGLGLVAFNLNPRGEERAWTLTENGSALLAKIEKP